MPDYPNKIDSYALSTGPAIPIRDYQARLRGNGRSDKPRYLDGAPHMKLALAMIVQGVKHGDEPWLRSPQCQFFGRDTGYGFRPVFGWMSPQWGDSVIFVIYSKKLLTPD